MACVEFIGYIPELTSAFVVSGSQNGGKIIVAFPETEAPKACP